MPRHSPWPWFELASPPAFPPPPPLPAPGRIVVESPRRGIAAVGRPGGIVSFHQAQRLIDDAGGAHVPIAPATYLAMHDDDPARLAYVVKVSRWGRSTAVPVVAVEYTPYKIYMLSCSEVWPRAFRCRIANVFQLEVARGVWMEMHEVRDGDRIAVDPSGYALADHTEHKGNYEAMPPFVCRSLGLNPPEPQRATRGDAQVIRTASNGNEWFVQPANIARDTSEPTPQPDPVAEAARLSTEAARERERRRVRAMEYTQMTVRAMNDQLRRMVNNRPPQGGSTVRAMNDQLRRMVNNRPPQGGSGE